ncbi:Uncharacterised protein [Paucimonas lemoignei]|nr:Uncharacterised protein [Paucimonas lemoignei]
MSQPHPVGANSFAKAVCQAMKLLIMPTLSRMNSLPPEAVIRHATYFRLIVVLTPSFTLSSSNQRAVTVLV